MQKSTRCQENVPSFANLKLVDGLVENNYLNKCGIYCIAAVRALLFRMETCARRGGGEGASSQPVHDVYRVSMVQMPEQPKPAIGIVKTLSMQWLLRVVFCCCLCFGPLLLSVIYVRTNLIDDHSSARPSRIAKHGTPHQRTHWNPLMQHVCLITFLIPSNPYNFHYL